MILKATSQDLTQFNDESYPAKSCIYYLSRRPHFYGFTGVIEPHGTLGVHKKELMNHELEGSDLRDYQVTFNK